MNTIKKIIKNPLFALSIIIIIAAVLRFLEVNKVSFWYDEAFTGDTIRYGWNMMFDVIKRDKVHPPLFYILTKLWAMIFGYNQTSIRSFSVLFGVTTVGLSYFYIKDLFENKVKYPFKALILAFALAISPFFVGYSVEARSYSFIAFTALSLVYFTLKTFNATDKKKLYLGLSIVSAITLLFTHYLQAIFLIGLVYSILVYKYVYTKEGVNRRALTITLAISLLGFLLLVVIPIKAILASKGIYGSWWIPQTRIDDGIRASYTYLFGVVRYAQGVTPAREMYILISPFVFAGVIFAFHLFSMIEILRSKVIERQVKRDTLFIYITYVITIIGFMSLTFFGLNTMVERYTIAAGILLFVSLFLNMGILFKKWSLIFIFVYLVLVLLIKPMPSHIDYVGLAKDLQSKYPNVNRVIYNAPADMIITMFYTGEDKAYYITRPGDNYTSWALLRQEREVYVEQIKSNDLLVVNRNETQQYKDKGFKIISEFGDFSYMMRN